MIVSITGKAVKDELDFCRQEEKRVEDSFGSLYATRDKNSSLQVYIEADHMNGFFLSFGRNWNLGKN